MAVSLARLRFRSLLFEGHPSKTRPRIPNVAILPEHAASDEFVKSTDRSDASWLVKLRSYSISAEAAWPATIGAFEAASLSVTWLNEELIFQEAVVKCFDACRQNTLRV